MYELGTAAHAAHEFPYEAIVADTDLGRRVNYRLRYDVYCLESGFEDPGNFPDREESDEHDDRSAHFLVRCNVTGEWVAGTRLVVRRDLPLPVEEHCRIDPSRFSRFGPPDGEISRLLIVKGNFVYPPLLGTLSRAGEPDRSATAVSRTEVLRRMLISVFSSAYDLGMHDVAYFMTPGLRRVVERLGIECLPIGEACHHRGVRFPHRTLVDQALDALYTHGPAFPGLREVTEPYQLFSEVFTPSVGDVVPFRPACKFPDPSKLSCLQPT